MISKEKDRGGCYEVFVLPEGIANNQQTSEIQEDILCPVIDDCVCQH